jgi:hypothetical protein
MLPKLFKQLFYFIGTITSNVSIIGQPTSNVSIIGQRMNYGFGCGDFEEILPSALKIQNKEHPRHYKHTKG